MRAWLDLTATVVVLAGVAIWGAAADGAGAGAEGDAAAPAVAPNTLSDAEREVGFVLLFNGDNLDGWRAGENPNAWRVEDGKIIADGPRSHLFYMGEVNEGKFQDFELRSWVYVHPRANSGIYFHVVFKESGWPIEQGYEAQINNTHSDWRRTGGVYGRADVREAPVADGEWFDYHIIVRGSRVILKVNGQVTADYTEPADARRLVGGTFALQCHDPRSKVEFHTIRVKVLDEADGE